MKDKIELQEMNYVPVGLSCKEEVVIRCSNCDAKLGIFLLVNKEELDPNTGRPYTSDVIIKCCYCSDKSFPITLAGRFLPGGYHETVDGDADNVVGKTLVEFEDIDEETGNVIFKAIKI